jgi:phage N-6-adenine-methyltransferase
MSKEAMFKSQSCDWPTPQGFFDELNKEFGFQLDVCADEKNHKCAKFFDMNTNGLMHRWAPAVCWMNPPYGGDLPKWMAKAYEESQTVVCLVPARVDTAWFQDLCIGVGAEIRFIRGRLKFGNATNSAPFPSAVVIYKAKVG